MHDAARSFVRWARTRLEPPRTVVEIGSLNINGSIRDLFAGASEYTGIDIRAGAGVDIVADAVLWRPPQPVDLVVCCEVLEHTAAAAGIVQAAASYLRPGGAVIITAAGPGRASHSWNGGPLTGAEYYAPVTKELLAEWMQPFVIRHLDYDGPTMEDIYAIGVQ